MAEQKRGRRPLVIVGTLIILIGAGLWLRPRPRAPDGEYAEGPKRARPLGAVSRPASEPAPAGDATIEGRVLDPDGKPATKARVLALRQRDRDELMTAGRAPLPKGAPADAEGRFQITGLAPGRYNVAATAPGLTGAFASGVSVKSGQGTTIELRLRRDGVTVSGRVLDAGGGPIPGATVRALFYSRLGTQDAPPESAVFEAIADESGAYSLQLPAGRQSLTAEASGYTTGREYLDLASNTSQDFRLEPAARISGRVLARSDRAPIAGAEVVAEASERQPDGFVEPVTTDEQGAFRFTTLRAGSYRLRARKGPLVGALEQPLAISVVAPHDGAEVLVEVGLVLSGTVKDKQGKGVAEARVSVYPERAMGRALRPSTGTTDPEGRYRVEGLQPGRLRWGVSVTGYPGASGAVTLEADQTLDITLEDGVIVKGVVLTSAGQPAAGADLEAQVRPASRDAMFTGDRAKADAQGRFEMKRLGAGELTLSARFEQETASLGPETITAGAAKELTIKLAAGARVSGTLTWEDGPPAPGIKIRGTGRGGGRLELEAITDEGGHFTVGPFPPGEASVVAIPPGERISWSSRARPEQADLKLAAGEHKADVKLVVPRRNGHIKGVVLAPNGKALDGAVVRAGVELDGRAWGGRDGRTTTAPDGTFAIENLPKGTYTLWAAHGDLAETERTGVSVGATDVKLVLATGATISGVAVDRAGKPLRSVKVSAHLHRVGESESLRLRQAAGYDNVPKAVGDPVGAFRLERLGAGTYDLVGQAPDGTIARVTGVTVKAGEHKQGVRLVAEGAITVTGKITEYESGQPLAGVSVRARSPVSSEPGAQATTDAAGVFTLPNVAKMPAVLVSIDAPQRSHIPEGISLPAGAEGRVDLGTIRLLKADPTKPNRGRVGLTFEMKDGKVIISGTAPDSPAAKAGLKSGDVILSVNGQKNADVESMGAAMRGDPDKVITVTVQTPGQPPREVTLKRAL